MKLQILNSSSYVRSFFGVLLLLLLVPCKLPHRSLVIKLVSPPMRTAVARHSLGLKTCPVKGQTDLLVGVNDNLMVQTGLHNYVCSQCNEVMILLGKRFPRLKLTARREFSQWNQWPHVHDQSEPSIQRKLSVVFDWEKDGLHQVYLPKTCYV